MNEKVQVARRLCEGLRTAGELSANPRELEALATNMVVVATYWLSYSYVLDPRRSNEPAVVGAALQHGCYQTMALTAPYLRGDARALFERLAVEYLGNYITTENQETTMAKGWTKFPHEENKFEYTRASLKKSWDRLHKGDAEPFPKSDTLSMRGSRFIPVIFRPPPNLARRRELMGQRCQQVAGDLCELPGGERQEKARAVRGSRVAC